MNRATRLLLCLFGIASSNLINIVAARLDAEGIVGGLEASPNQFPYLVSVYHTNRAHNCMGGILNDHYILTAAHCIVNPATDKFIDIPIEIVVDTVDLVNDPGIRIKIEKGYVLKDYVQAGNHNDIGILKLSESLDLAHNPQRQKLNLPKVGVEYPGTEAAIAGFGWTNSRDNSTMGKHLMYWTSKVMAYKECQKNWEFDIQNYLCSQMLPRPDSAAVGICNGDSGSPLVINNTVVGVAIIAEMNCDEWLRAALYTNVSKYLPFIQTVLSGQLKNEVVEYKFPSPS